MKFQKVKLTISYDGSKFSGSQIQPLQVKTVAKSLELAFKYLNITNPNLLFSGRTDKGVHSINQIASIEIEHYWLKDIDRLKNAINKIVKPAILIKKIEICANNFHPRFEAKKRVYRYIITDEKFNPFMDSYVTFVKTVDEERIKDAIKIFQGVHNFEFFKKNGSGVINFERVIYKTKFYKYKNLYIFYFEANGFLRSQIRLMVEFLLKISDGVYTKEDLINQLKRKKQIETKPAPPNGLYLTRIKY